MKTKKNKKQGWHEDKDPLTGRAKLHSEVALKNKFEKEQISDTNDIIPVKEDETVNLRYEDSEDVLKYVGDYEEENDIELHVEYEDDAVIVEIPIEKSEDFIGFMEDKGIKAKAETLEESKPEEIEKEDTEGMISEQEEPKIEDVKQIINESEDSKNDDVNEVVTEPAPKNSVDDIISNAQSKRSKRAVVKDKSRTAKKIVDKNNAGELVEWLKSPGKSDIQGIDTAE